MGPPDRDRAAVGPVGEVEVGLDGPVVRLNLRPGPAGHGGTVEVGGQRPAEVAAVDRTGAPDRHAPHDVGAALWFGGQLCPVALDQRAGRPDRQLQAVVGELANSGLVGAGTGFHDGDPAGRIGREAFGEDRSGATGTDDQNVAVRDVGDHQVRF